jgi:hypothetical protein
MANIPVDATAFSVFGMREVVAAREKIRAVDAKA